MTDAMPRWMKQTLSALASLRLTVALFALSMFLIFAGTLAQVHAGIWTVMEQYFRTPVAWIELQLFVPQQVAAVPGAFPFPGGFVLVGLMIVNLLAAHWVRFKFSRKRIGIILLHLGVIVLLVGEIITAVLADEGMMTIYEGSHSQYVEDFREVELAFLDRSNPEQDQVVAVPESWLTREGETVRHPDLPVEVRIDRWMPNSRLFTAPSNMPLPATEGFGLQAFAEPQPPASGVDGQTIDAPTAYITLSKDGQALGTWLVSLHLHEAEPQQVTVDGRTYDMTLRFKRTYKPYTLHLIDFRHDRFVGTQTPRNFSSLIRLIDPAQNEDREVLIRMNQPLRYAGATFYQSAFKGDDEATVLQVVRNPGWLLPYIACGMVAAGMLIHFGAHLVQFLRRTVR